MSLEDQLRELYRTNLGREADVGGLQHWAREMGGDDTIDVAERLRFLEAAQPEVQQRLAAQDSTLPGVARVSPEARRALASQDLTTEQYKTLSDYFGNKWIGGEAEDPASLTRRDYIERPRSGYDFATFLATRSPQHGAQTDNTARLADLLAPYLGAGGAARSASDESAAMYVTNPITGATELAQPLGGDNLYRVHQAPHHGTIGGEGNRFAVGRDYYIDPVTGESRFVGSYTSPYTDRGHRDWQAPLTLAALAAGAYYFPTFVAGELSLPNVLASNALNAGVKAVTKARGGALNLYSRSGRYG